MGDERLRAILTKAVEQLRGATDLTMDEVIGIRALPESARTPEVCYSLGIIEGAASALRATPREMLGRVFGLVGTAAPAGHALAFAAGGFLVDAFSPKTVFLIAGLGVLLILIPIMLVLGRSEVGSTPQPDVAA